MNQPNWKWNDITKTYEFETATGVYSNYSSVSKFACHEGNTAIYVEKNGGTLFIGGWNNKAVVTPKTHVIDLTGTEHKFYEFPLAFDDVSKGFLPFVQQGCAGWLSLPFPDMGVPSALKTYEQWHGIAMQIKKILKSGNDVLVACLGGHGRSGMFVSIVGYILGNKVNRAWSSPVEHVRGLHCDQAVETFAQEKYVYDILGLDIQIKRTYAVASTGTSTYAKCELCGTDSTFVKDLGMCLTCSKKWSETAPVKDDITEEDLDNILPHKCLDKKTCLGIYTASGCKHTVHDMIIIDGLCETCHWEAEQFEKDGVKVSELAITQKEMFDNCAVCEKASIFGKIYGVCYDCAEDLRKTHRVDFVHNSITDPYKTIPHHCEHDKMCTGIIAGDVCGHVVHNLEITDGKCPDCINNNRNPTGV